MIMSPGDRAWDDERRREARKSEAKTARPASAGVAAMAAVVALATVAGALGGALATAGLGHFAAGDDRSVREQQRAGSLRRADRCRHRRAEGQCRAHLQDGHEPVQQDQRPSRQGREGAGRAGRQARQAERGRRQAARRAGAALPSPRLPRPRRRTSPDRSRRRHAPRRPCRCRPKPKSAGCRRSKAGCCATSPMAAR